MRCSIGGEESKAEAVRRVGGTFDPLHRGGAPPSGFLSFCVPIALRKGKSPGANPRS